MWLSAIKLAVSAGSKIYANKQKAKMAMSDAQLLHAERQAHHKDTWRWRINGLGALQSLDKMISYMCKRRQEKFNNVVQCLKISN